MWKPLVVLAIVANTVLITPSEGTKRAGPYSKKAGHNNPHRKCKKPNEIYDLCPNPCPPRECGINKALILCAPPPKPGSSDCKPGCRCADGFLKNRAGTCIPEKECKYDCAKNETLDPCFSGCPPRLCGVNIAAVSCLAIEDRDCKPGCRCSDGYLRNAEGNCILECDCPQCTSPNEVYDICPAPCPPRRCDVDETLIDCIPPPKPGDPECEPGCRCADGFVRNPDGICVTRDQCPQCTGPNEVYDVCLTPCPPQRCDVNLRVIKCAPPLKPGDPNCEAGCRCVDGYVRNEDGICIPRDQCPQNCKGKHEIYSECPALAGRPLNCTQVGFPQPQINPGPDPSHCPGKPRCICENEYARDSRGKCIPIKECPSCGGDPNAVSGCGVNCGRHCSDRNKKHPATCNKKCKDNGCDCREGYWYDDITGKCVLPEDCKHDCAKNETLDPCFSGCPPRLCGVNIAAVSCLAIEDRDCKPGCRCSDGYLRNAEGNCILECDCPQCTGPNEVYDVCPAPCPPQRCDVDPRVIRCAAPPKPGDPNCEPGCRCVDGHVRNEDGICIPRDQCPQNCKGKHEIYSECPALAGRPLNCTQVGFPQPQINPGPDPSHCPGKPRCICENEYARDSRGKCIPIKECPSCGGDPNAVSGCGVNCGRHCSDRNKKHPGKCNKKCKDNGCDCREGHWYDDNTGKCVLPEDCTPVCGKDEVYSACTNSDCEPKNCSQLGFPIPCPRIDPAYCIKGCSCEAGLVRDANGICIPKEKCPSCGGDQNAVSGCGINCGRRCSTYNSTKPVICPDICKINGCSCREGFVYDDSTGKCIRPNQCVSCGGDFNAEPGCDKNCTKRCPGPKPAECKCYKDGCVCKDDFVYDPKVKKCVRLDECTPPCGNNEVLSNCSNGGCGPWRCTDVGIPTGCVKMDQKYCIVDCVCKEGYVRDDKEVCIPATHCPECGGDPNAVAGCGINCGRLCSNYKNAENISCITVCLDNACDCRKGFVKDENTDRCVLPKDCTQECGKNEVFSPCVNGGCQAKNCSQIGESVPCVRPAKCKPGCLCAEGFLRDANGKCIPKDKCPPKCKGANEIYDPCPPSCPPQTCESIGQKYFCPLMPANKTSEDCHGACRCKPNFFRNKLGDCISAKNCLKCRGPHEFFSCGGACDNVCETLDKQNQTRCPIINIKCNEMCYCEEGHARDKNKICIPIDQCPGKCCENERWEECPARLCSPQSCKDLGFERDCVNAENSTCPGPPGCVCDYNYVRDENGKCIPAKECPSCGNDPNAEAGCGLNCGRLCSNYDKGPVPCPRICRHNACDCKKDYVLDQNINKCVLPKHCTPVCKEHEVYSECTNGGCQARNCSQLGNPVPCVKLDPKSCIKGCVCEEGYLRARNGTCVPIEKCDNCNKPHEHYDPCAPSCPPQTCESIGRRYKCPVTAAVCKGACRCNKGYLRNKKGECIRKKHCLKCKGPHEYFSCGSACDNVCSTLHKQNQTNCPIKNIKCNRMCYCEEGYARNIHNVCIPIDKCPKPRCGVNERLEQCPPGLCTPQKCSQLGFPCPCPDLPKYGCPEPPGCVCIDDYVRDSRGRCIPNKDCPSCGGDPNAVSGCGMNCGRTCSTYNRNDISCAAVCYFNACDCRKGYVYDENLKKCVRPKECTPTCKKNEVYDSCANGGCGKWNCSQLGQPDLCIDVIECIGGCICQKGYLRANNGTCVPINQCPKPPCGKNERFEFCPDSLCEPQKCTELGFPVMCPALTGDFSCPGQPACICDNGFVRNDDGTCIPKKECPSCNGDPNAESGCGINCGRLCSNYNKGPVSCPKICKLNACDCKKDFVFDMNTGKCVHPKRCTPICGKDEVYSECINGGCQPKNCSQLGKPVPCVKMDPKYCIKGCLCKEGYLREPNGVCVPKEECGRNCGGPHEVYEPCPPSCPPQTCESINKTYHCPLMKIDKKDCKPACRCKEGYLRNKIGQCISKANCLKCTGPNEYFSCGGACDNVCATLREQNQTNCPIVNIVCNPMCYCEKGYARDDKNVCVPIDKCPPPKCGKNERLEDCPDWLCSPQSCFQLGYPTACPAIQGDSSGNQTCCPGRPGCVCIDNYVRDDSGECIPKDKCPSCGGDPNAVSGCGSNCGRLCSNYKKKNVVCTLLCKLNGCDCREGYVFDSNLEKCVQPKHCTQVCGLNEVYDTCANGGCQKRNCSQVGEPMLCIDPIKCNGGCVCKKGFLRNQNGTCVPEDKCPRIECTKPHEVYDPCPRTCPPQTCAAIGKAYPCPNPPEGEEFCLPACRCEDGYYRNSIDECVSEADCLKCTKPNEHFACGPACDNVCATLATQNQTNCPIINKKCNPKCYCDEGHARDDNDMCIRFDQCGVSCNGDPNAVEGCGNHCGNRCSTYNKGVTACPLFCLLNGCDCKPGYIFDDNLDKCVLPKDCTPVCGNNEVYNTCINGGCQRKKCSDLSRPIICIDPIKCIDGCLCKEGFLRAENGTCVPIDKCPTPVCPKHEVYDRCANGGCNRRKCSELTFPIICRDPIECIGDCVCVKGYLRNEDGVCVPERKCNPQCNRPHEVFNPCPSTCPPQTCESLDRAYICPIERGEDSPCQPGCVCEDGFFTNKIGECVSQENCLKCMGPHEYFSCGGACDNVCDTLSEQNQTNCPIVNVKCNEMCYCEEGYARNGSNICVPIKECPVKCYGEHKVFNPCPRTCPPQTCESLDKVYICYPETGEPEPPCEPGCVCEEGYYENAIGQCLTEKECLRCNGPHEYYSCGGACDNVCATLNEQSQANCPFVNVKCNEMCYCEEGYARNASNICIPIKDCPPSRCGPDERYEESPCRVCEPLTCCEVGMEMECPPVNDNDCDDTPACICKHGLVRNDNGVCIPVSECPSENTAVNVTEARARLDQGSIALSGKFLHYLVSTKPDENCVASATSLTIPLAQLALYAKGLVLEQLLKLIGLRNKEEIKACFPELTAEFSNQSHVVFEVATKYYANKDRPLSSDFIRDSSVYFQAGGENVDFSKSVPAAALINKWVSDRTHGKIQDLVKPEMFSSDTRLCLVNAIYFLGNWVKKFNPNDTQTKDFHKSNGETVPLKIMYQQNTFNYAENDKYQVLEMFYKGNNFSCMIVLPRNKEDLLVTLETIGEPDEWNKIMQSLKPEKCDVHIPKMLINTETDVKELLKKYGASEMFNPISNGLVGLLEIPEQVYVSDAVQKAFMELDETGTEAAAATAITVGVTSAMYPPPKRYEFMATRSFAFYILLRSKESPYKTPLFCGTFVGGK